MLGGVVFPVKFFDVFSIGLALPIEVNNKVPADCSWIAMMPAPRKIVPMTC